jgi:hypothetical protein
MRPMDLMLYELVGTADDAYREFRWKVVDCFPIGTPLVPDRLSLPAAAGHGVVPSGGVSIWPTIAGRSTSR